MVIIPNTNDKEDRCQKDNDDDAEDNRYATTDLKKHFPGKMTKVVKHQPYSFTHHGHVPFHHRQNQWGQKCDAQSNGKNSEKNLGYFPTP